MFFRCLYLDENATLIFILRFLNLSTYPCQGTVRTVQTCFFFISGPSCGGVRTQVAGVFSSANFPNNYTNNTTCTWRISVELANHITLNFTDFDLENSSGCENAYVHVYDGLNTTDPSLGKFCGSEIPPGVRSSGSKMLVIFHGYNGARYKGFRAYYDSGGYQTQVALYSKLKRMITNQFLCHAFFSLENLLWCE